MFVGRLLRELLAAFEVSVDYGQQNNALEVKSVSQRRRRSNESTFPGKHAAECKFARVGDRARVRGND